MLWTGFSSLNPDASGHYLVEGHYTQQAQAGTGRQWPQQAVQAWPPPSPLWAAPHPLVSCGEGLEFPLDGGMGW